MHYFDYMHYSGRALLLRDWEHFGHLVEQYVNSAHRSESSYDSLQSLLNVLRVSTSATTR